MNRMSTARLAMIAGCAIASTAAAQLIDVEPSKANGTFISGSGIPGDNFMGDVGDIGVYIKARARVGGQPIAVHGNTYIVLDGEYAPSTGVSWWSFDFQFSPNAADTIAGQNYNLSLQLDLDSSFSTSYAAVSWPMFDDDVVVGNSWDENDGYFVNPGGAVWSDNNIDYVMSQSWRADFGFLNGSILPAGDYDLRFSATPTDGPIASRTVARHALVRVIPADDAALTLDVQDECLGAGETQVVVEVNLSNAQDIIVGGQFFLQYDTSKLTFVSADPGDAPFTSEVFELVNAGLGEITYAVGIPSGSGTDDATTMARLTFTTTADFCAEDDLVAFRTGVLPTRITDDNGTDIQPTLVNTHLIERDSVAPSITAPPPISVYADAGSCTATLDNVENFENPIATGPTQAPGVWYTDRFDPAEFEATGGELHIGIDDADFHSSGLPNFYNTQGRKYDVDIPVGYKWSGKLYIGTDWTTTVKRSDIWATTFDSGGNISGYPILGFVSNNPSDDLNPSATPVPRFRWYSQDTDQNPSNGYTAGWVELGLPGGFVYDAWYTLEVEMTDAAFIARVKNASGDILLSFTDVLTFGSIRAGNLIMQAYNFGEDYDVYWDDIVVGPQGPIATDNCSALDITYERSDNPLLSLADPFPEGTTTVTWTATDACGNTSSDTQLVTVDGMSLLDVAVELQGMVEVGPFDRCITFELFPFGGGLPTIVTETMTFNSGIAVGAIEVPCFDGGYICITARDALHTLRKTDNDNFSIVGPNYYADFTTAGDGDELIGGNLNDDPYIDILDFGIFIGQFGTFPAVNTPCGFVGPHADVSGDGEVEVGDFTFIQINFLEFSELRCDGSLLIDDSGDFASAKGLERRTGPVTSISIDQLHGMGMGNLAEADLNGDGMLDTGDVAAFLNGARPDHMADLDGSGLVDFFDVQKLLGVLGQSAGLPYDMNGDGLVSIEDLNFVIARMGMQF